MMLDSFTRNSYTWQTSTRVVESTSKRSFRQESAGAHLPACLGSNESGNGAVVVVVRPDENAEERRVGAAPLQRLGRKRHLEFDGCLTARVALCGAQTRLSLKQPPSTGPFFFYRRAYASAISVLM